MTTDAAPGPARAWGGRLLALVPILLLVAAAALFTSSGGSVTGLVGDNPPPADAFDVRRVEFAPDEVRIRVRNPQPEDLTIAAVTIDDAVYPFTVDGGLTLGRLRSATIRVPFTWVEDDPYTVGVTSSTGVETPFAVAAAVPAREAGPSSVLGYALIGLLVGVLPVALGMLWLPSLRRADPRWVAAFMALTAGLLTFLAVEALGEALALQGVLPGGLGGPGLVLAGAAASYLGLAWVGHRLARRGPAPEAGAPLAGLALATMVAIGIGVHNLGEGLAIGTSFALGELALGTFLIVGFMVHNVTEGLGIVAPLADGRAPGPARLGVLALVAGAPAVLGAWIGGFLTNDVLAVLFFSLAVGAALQVVVEVGRHVARRAPGGLGSGPVVGGFLAGIAVMYLTGVIAG